MTTNHPTWDTLNDYVDGALGHHERQDVQLHLRGCTECSATLSALEGAMKQMATLPAAIEPPQGLWDDVRASIDARKQIVIPDKRASASVDPESGGVARTAGTRAFIGSTRLRLAAAAVLLVVASSATTAIIMRNSSNPSTAASPVHSNVLPVSWQSAERGYLKSVDELRAQLDAQRDRLAPATISAVERSLAAIDVAIAEARQALINDPANAALSELLASNYRQKVELLRRAAQLNVIS